MKFFSEKDIDVVFRYGVILKAVEGALETAAGFLFMFVGAGFINNFVSLLTREELAEDSKDVIANLLVHWSQSITLDTQIFVAVFLLVHGIVNLTLALGILKKKLWAYYSAIIIFAVFIAYQIYRITYSHSIVLGAVIVFDAVLIGLIIHELKHFKNNLLIERKENLLQ